MEVADEIILWPGERTKALLEGNDLGGFAPVVVARSEQELWANLPPRKNARLYLLDADCTLAASPALSAALASRPASWPPIVVFGLEEKLVKASGFRPNSQICGEPQKLLGDLRLAAHYWVHANAPMLIE